MGLFKTAFLALLGFSIVSITLVNAFDRDDTELAATPAGPSMGTDALAGASHVETGTSTIVMKDIKFTPSNLAIRPGTTVTWTNDDPMGHTVTPVDVALWGSEGSGDDAPEWLQKSQTWSFTFHETGSYSYYCLPHASRGADGTYRGMVGTITVNDDAAPSTSGAAHATFSMPNASVAQSPIAPGRIQPDADGIVRVTLETREVTAKLADGVAYTFWTFDGTVPGPMIRVREGDRVEVTLKNDASSVMAHSVDFHAATGPGGGAKATQTKPGESTTFTFKAMAPGIYVYHCATPHIPSHVANGMYGMIVVEPKEGWPAVDREFYVVEGEWYTTGGRGAEGLQSLSLEKLQNEAPDHFTFNGPVGALTGDNAMKAFVGEKIRIFFGVGGGIPSSFHVIGEIFDEVSMDGNDASTHNRQTVLVPAAGSAMIDITLDVPGDYLLVDHTLTRAIDGGAVGILHVEGAEDPDIFHGSETPGSGH